MPLHAPQTLRQFVKRLVVPEADRTARLSEIAREVLESSSTLCEPDFTRIARKDVERLFRSYDERFFGGLLQSTLCDVPIEFRVSSRMTNAGGKTASWRANRRAPITRFEIAVSSTLLFRTFTEQNVHRPITVTGLECRNRLEALMRVMEHEIVHLTELLAWDASTCRGDRFQAIAWQAFGHTDHRHSLVTPREQAASQGIRAGVHVSFVIDGRTLCGIVNRVTKRATVLVPDDGGRRYSNGVSYAKYYVPLSQLTLIGAQSPS